MKGRQGIDSKHLTHRPVKLGVGAKAVSQVFVSRIGSSQGNHITERAGVLRNIRTGPYQPPNFMPVKLGNELASQVKCGPGGGRVVRKAGGQHGLTSPTPRPKARSID